LPSDFANAHPGSDVVGLPHLRLLELYYDLERREAFERVARRFSEHFTVGPIRWVLIKVEFWAQLDRIAAALLQKTMA